MAGTTGSKALSAQVKPSYPRSRKKPKLNNPWTSQNKNPKRK